MANEHLKKKIGKGRHASTIKRHRQSKKRYERNKSVRSAVKTSLKKVRTSITAKNKEEATKNLKATIALLQKAASKGVIPKRRASRLSSRLARSTIAIG